MFPESPSFMGGIRVTKFTKQEFVMQSKKYEK